MSVLKEQSFTKQSDVEWENTDKGVRRKIMGYGDSAMSVCVQFKKGAVGSLHHHRHVQISFVHSGSFEVQIGSEKKKLATGDSFYVASDVEHGVVALEDGTLIDFFSPMREDFVK